MRDPEPQLRRYEELLRAWAPKLNLVSLDDLGRLRTRHIDDALRLVPLLADLPPGPCIDVGSGAGLPGIPLAISGPSRRWRLLEPRRRRAAFLEEVVRELELDAEVIAGTAEEAAVGLGPVHALAVARALAEPPAAFALLRPLVAENGVAAVFLGREAEVPAGAEEWAEGVAIVRS
jgi:16S rRNA (guanine527-N7)-methyltransferase